MMYHYYCFERDSSENHKNAIRKDWKKSLHNANMQKHDGCYLIYINRHIHRHINHGRLSFHFYNTVCCFQKNLQHFSYTWHRNIFCGKIIMKFFIYIVHKYEKCIFVKIFKRVISLLLHPDILCIFCDAYKRPSWDFRGLMAARCGRGMANKGRILVIRTIKSLIYDAPNLKTWMLLVSSCSCLYPICWSQVLNWEWRCSWSSADRRCSNYI